VTDADRILTAIAKLEFEGTAARLRSALEPFGLHLWELQKTDKFGSAEVRLGPSRDRSDGDVVGFAGWLLTGSLAINIYETERVWLRKPISLSFRSASAEQIYDRINAVIMKRLRPRSMPVRKAPAGGGHREMLCTHTTHADPVTWHSFQSTNASGGSVWRCGECGHNTPTPLAAPFVAGGLSLSK
jgi:hypothetical protein